ncbi:MAG: ArnT family glycosyltransferase, partial [Candidatus Nanohaloarchaea archaeon]
MLRGTDAAVERCVELLRTYRYLAFILVVAAVLRVYRLGVEPLWADEAVYAFASRQLLRTASFVPYYPASDTVITGHPPLTFYILGLVQLVGTSDLVVRLPSAVFGVATVLVVYRIGAEIYNRRTGLLAALFLAVSPVHLLYSREALPVAAALFFLSLSVYYVLQRSDDCRFRDTAAAVGAGALAFLSHFMSLSLVFFLLPVAFFSEGKRWMRRAAKTVLPLTLLGIVL